MNHDALSLLPDEQLIALLRKDDRGAFELIYHRYSPGLYASAYNLLRNKEVCEDLLQELFIDFWQKRHTLHIRSLKAYLYKAIRNRVLSYIRAEKSHEVLKGIEDNIEALYSPEGKLLEKEVQQALQACMQQLPDKCREIFFLSRRQYLSNREISDLLHISPKTVENQITIALRKLKIIFGDFLLIAFILLFY